MKIAALVFFIEIDTQKLKFLAIIKLNMTSNCIYIGQLQVNKFKIDLS